MNHLRIATFNTAGMADPTRRSLMLAFFRSLNVHIICLQETHSRPEDETDGQTNGVFGRHVLIQINQVNHAKTALQYY